MAFVFAEEGIICEILESEVLEREGRKQLMELEQRLRHQEAARKQVDILHLSCYLYIFTVSGLLSGLRERLSCGRSQLRILAGSYQRPS